MNYHKRPFDYSIIHCCTEKTASQWFKKFLSDPIILKKSKLKIKSHAEYFKPLIYNNKGENDFYAFSRNLYKNGYSYNIFLDNHAISTSMYISYNTFKNMIKTNNYKTFFILRDPRDIMISVYFSMKYSHPLINQAAENARLYLNENSFSEGLKYCIDTTVDKSKLFVGQRNWVDQNLDSRKEKIFRYEQLSENYENLMDELFNFIGLNITSVEKEKLINKYQFKNFSEGREIGKENQKSHYRKGKPGEWKEYFDRKMVNYFKGRTGNLIETLGYFW